MHARLPCLCRASLEWEAARHWLAPDTSLLFIQLLCFWAVLVASASIRLQTGDCVVEAWFSALCVRRQRGGVVQREAPFEKGGAL